MTAAHRQRACSLGDIDGGNEIGMVLETTGFATEMGLGRAIALLTVPTSWAGAGSVPGVYIDNRDASLRSEERRVGNERRSGKSGCGWGRSQKVRCGVGAA